MSAPLARGEHEDRAAECGMSKATSERKPAGISANCQRHAEELRKLWPSTMTTLEIAKRFGISQTTVCVWAKALGLPDKVRNVPHRRTLREAEPTPQLFRCVCGGRSADERALEMCVHLRG